MGSVCPVVPVLPPLGALSPGRSFSSNPSIVPSSGLTRPLIAATRWLRAGRFPPQTRQVRPLQVHRSTGAPRDPRRSRCRIHGPLCGEKPGLRCVHKQIATRTHKPVANGPRVASLGSGSESEPQVVGFGGESCRAYREGGAEAELSDEEVRLQTRPFQAESRGLHSDSPTNMRPLHNGPHRD